MGQMIPLDRSAASRHSWTTFCLWMAILGQSTWGFAADSLVSEIRWTASDPTYPKSVSIEKDSEHGTVLRWAKDKSEGAGLPVVNLTSPKLSERSFSIRGKMKCEGVTAQGYLEMWTFFPQPKPGQYFSRGFAFSGNSSWQDFDLPFTFDDPSVPMPERITMGIVMPGEGTVSMTELQLVERPASAAFGQPFTPAMISTIILSCSIAVVVLGTLVGIGIWILRKKQRDAEQRRMRALDY